MMKQISRALVVAVCLAMAGSVSALGLGKLEQSSSLNERFEGRIPILSATADELSTLKIGLAQQSEFRRAGINYMSVLRDLNFKLVEPESGQDYIHVTSSQPIREPFLNFLLELRWSAGRLYREYTVLLDPLTYEPNERVTTTPPAAAPVLEEKKAVQAPSRYSHTVIYPEDQPSGPVRPSYSSSSYGGSNYGPVQSGDTLWSIAESMKSASVTTHQMMLALLRANPDAFIGNNINGLRRGAILRMPSADKINAMSQAEALSQVKNQHTLWQSARQSVAAAPAVRADSTAPTATGDVAETVAAATPAADSRLELVGAEAGALSQAGDVEGGDAELSQELAIANEKLDALTQENAELRDRLAENEALIEDLKRLIVLKDDELALLQERTAEEAAGIATAPATSVPQVAGVNYPNGDPAQFIGEIPPAGELLPGPVPPASEISHTVNRPPSAVARIAANNAPEAGAGASGSKVDDETSAKPTAATPAAAGSSDTSPAVAGSGLLGMAMGLVGSARDFMFENLPMVGGIVAAIIILLATAMYMRQRQARTEEQSDVLAAGAFPDFAAGSELERGGFEDLSASVTADTVVDDASAQPDDAVTAEDEEDLFVVPEGQAGEAEAADEEEDPLAEVNVLMAYEHFDQAEAFVRNALKSDPDNIDYQAKLLEVFYAAGNKRKYEEAASDLRDLTGGKGEHWDMAVAMWQELSPNRALFEGGEEEEETGDSTTASSGIVDITGNTAGGGVAADEGTGGGLDFDLGDSTAVGSSQGEDSDVLDLTASDESADDEILDLTASSNSDQDFDATQTLSQAMAGEEEDNALDISLEGGGGSDVLDITKGGEPASDEDDGSLDFTLDDEDTAEKSDVESASPAAYEDDNMLEFDGGIGHESVDDERPAVAADREPPVSADEDNALAFDTTDLDLEVENDSADTGGLDEIGEELDRLEQTLGTLSRQDTTQGFAGNTSDALESIDSALEEMGDDMDATNMEAESATATGSSDEADPGLDLSLDGAEGSTEQGDGDTNQFDISLAGIDAGDSVKADDDLTELSFDLDNAEDEWSSGTTSLEGSNSEDEVSAELSELSEELDSDDLNLDDQLEMTPGSGDEDLTSIDFDLAADNETDSPAAGSVDINLDYGSSDTVEMDTPVSAADDIVDLDLDLSADDIESDSSESIDMDSTVELPKHRADSDLTLQGTEDEGDGEDKTLFVARRSDVEQQSLEDELTTKLDLAKAYVELGDADSARGILEEVMQDGNEEQRHQAGELLAQL